MAPQFRIQQGVPVKELTSTLAAALAAPPIVHLELILTEGCNLGCSYCFEYNANRHNEMSVDVAKQAVNFLLEASRQQKRVGILFIGGEPMLRFDLLRTVVEYARSKSSQVGKEVYFEMQTNGLLLREEHLAFFREVGLTYCLSIDGAQATHDRHRKMLNGGGSFQIISKKMPLLKRYQHWQGARMTVTPDNAASLGDDIRHLHEELAINQFLIGAATHVNWSDEQVVNYLTGLKAAFEYFLSERLSGSHRIRVSFFELGQVFEAFDERRPTAWGCGAGNGGVAVDPQGQLHGCSKLAWGPNGNQDAPLPLGSVEFGINRPQNRLKLLDHTAIPRIKCHSCEISDSCQGGCHAANFVDTGNIYVPADYFCKLMFAQKEACDYARTRMKEVGITSLAVEGNGDLLSSTGALSA